MASPASIAYIQHVYALPNENYCQQMSSSSVDGPVLQHMYLNPGQTPLSHGHDYSATYLSPLSKPQVSCRFGNYIFDDNRGQKVVKKRISHHNHVMTIITMNEIKDFFREIGLSTRLLKLERMGGTYGSVSQATLRITLVWLLEGWSLVRDSYTNRNHCPSHEMWSYERDGRW